jgi:hypothetical protein
MTHDEVLLSIFDARGGADNFTAEQRSIASALAHAMIAAAAGDLQAADKISDLSAKLPGVPPPKEAFDIAKLSWPTSGH